MPHIAQTSHKTFNEFDVIRSSDSSSIWIFFFLIRLASNLATLVLLDSCVVGTITIQMINVIYNTTILLYYYELSIVSC
jgi:hypothetical protein